MKCYYKVIEVGGKQKVARWGGCSGGWLGGKLIDGGIQLGGSSWTEKMVVLRLKISGMWLFYKMFVCVIYVVLPVYYVLNWALWIIRSRSYEVC